MIFFVKDSRNRILYPSVKDRWAEKLVKRGRAKWIRRRVIILQLGYEVREAPRDKISYFSIGNDTGYGNIGYSLVKITGNKVLRILGGTGTLRTAEITELMTERKMYRKSRRHNHRLNTKFKKFKHPRNHRKVNEWREFNPTCQHLIMSHIRALDLIFKLIPKEHSIINIEYASFDLQKLTGNRNKSGEGASNVIQYVLHRDHHTCTFCGTDHQKEKNVVLDVHHMTQRAHGGSNKPGNLITLCKKCHDKHHKGKINANIEVSNEVSTRSTTLNSVMPRIFDTLKVDVPTYKYYGYETKEYRRRHKIEKTHASDAFCLAVMHLPDDIEIIDFGITLDFAEFRRHRRAWTQRREDRKYYLESERNNKGRAKAVAWNRRARTGQDVNKKPSLVEFRRANPGIQVYAKPAKFCRYKNKYGVHTYTPGTVVRNLLDGSVHVVQGNSDAFNYLTTKGNIRLVKKHLEVVKKFSGLVIL